MAKAEARTEAKNAREQSEAASKDRRYIRTERALMTTFDAQIRELPLNKISVKALAEAADISKPAFYLHYANVEELANAWVGERARDLVGKMDFIELLFSDPQAFVEHFFAAFKNDRDMGGLLFRRGLDQPFMRHFLRALKARMHEAGHAPEGELEADVAATMLIAGLLILPVEYEEDLPQAAKAAGAIVGKMQGLAKSGGE